MGIRVLGPLTIDGNGPGAAGLGARDRTVLAALVVAGDQALSVDQLADALWGDHRPASWRKVLQGCVARLRRVLGPAAIGTVSKGYRVTVGADEIDARRFERLVGRARELLTLQEPDRVLFTVDQALALWRGRALEDLRDWEPGRIEVGRLEELKLDAEELRIDAALRAGRHLEVLDQAHVRVAESPLRERRWALLALAQYQAGRQGEALATLRRARTALRDELGLDPGEDLVLAERAILRHDPSLARPADGTRYYNHNGATVAVRTITGLTWLVPDHHATNQIAVNPTTLAMTRRRTLPFGEIRGTPPGAWPGDKGFVGGTIDPTGLTHIGAREYDPALGRFISVDPLVNHLDPQTLNAYAYGNNAPTTFADPSGLGFIEGNGGLDPVGLETVPNSKPGKRIFKGSNKSKQTVRLGTKIGKAALGIKAGMENYLPDRFAALTSSAQMPGFAIAMMGWESACWQARFPEHQGTGAFCALTGLCGIVDSWENGDYYAAGYQVGGFMIDAAIVAGSSVIGGAAGLGVRVTAAGERPVVVAGGRSVIGAAPRWRPPSITVEPRHGRLTNGTHTLDAAGMEAHTNGAYGSGKSQFGYYVNSGKAALDAAAYADRYNLWVQNKAKVRTNQIVGYLGDGTPTTWINVYRNKNNFVHASPGNAP